LGTDPYKKDTDGDGVDDKQDAFPLDPKRWLPEPKPVPKITPIKNIVDNSKVTEEKVTIDKSVNSESQNNISDSAVTSSLIVGQQAVDNKIELNLSTNSNDLYLQNKEASKVVDASSNKNIFVISLFVLLGVALAGTIVSLLLWLRAKRR
jgi:hypothetical protein